MVRGQFRLLGSQEAFNQPTLRRIQLLLEKSMEAADVLVDDESVHGRPLDKAEPQLEVGMMRSVRARRHSKYWARGSGA